MATPKKEIDLIKRRLRDDIEGGEGAPEQPPSAQ
jgi:hypothetical protein